MQEAEIQYVLKQLHEELRGFINIIREIPYVALPPERPGIICFAERVKQLCGYDADEILADKEHWEKIIYPGDRKNVFTAYTECKNFGIAFEIEYRIVHKNGSLRYVTDKGRPIFDAKGNVILIEGAITAVGQSEVVEAMAASGAPKITAFSNDSSQELRKIKMG
jgi:PAS domain S-box-containing protein